MGRVCAHARFFAPVRGCSQLRKPTGRPRSAATAHARGPGPGVGASRKRTSHCEGTKSRQPTATGGTRHGSRTSCRIQWKDADFRPHGGCLRRTGPHGRARSGHARGGIGTSTRRCPATQQQRCLLAGSPGQVVSLAEFHTVVAQYGVGHRHMEEHVGKHHMLEVGFRLHGARGVAP